MVHGRKDLIGTSYGRPSDEHAHWVKYCIKKQLSLDKEVEKVSEGCGVLCKFKKFDLILVDFGQR